MTDNAVADDLDGADYTPDPSPTCTYTPAETATTVRLFRSGEFIALGAPSRTAARDSLTHAIDDLEQLGLPVPAAPEITIQNMVFTADLGTTLHLPAVAVGLGLDQTEYKPEQYPAVIYRPDPPAVVMQLFASGKLIITGITEPDLAQTALTVLANTLTDLAATYRSRSPAMLSARRHTQPAVVSPPQPVVIQSPTPNELI
jgi:transcription initiation factor TFIID TATA-box-binding protein